MDVDKRSIAVTHVDHLGLEKSVKMAYESEMLLSFIRNRFAGKRAAFVYEAGPTGFGLYDDIAAAGYDCLVVSPASVPTARGKRARTNRLDSRKLALQLRGGSLESIHVPTEEYRMLRELYNCARCMSVPYQQRPHEGTISSKWVGFCMGNSRRLLVQERGIRDNEP